MNNPGAAFTAYDNYLGYRVSCWCGWNGPWRGLWLSKVETDMLEHRANCPNNDTQGDMD